MYVIIDMLVLIELYWNVNNNIRRKVDGEEVVLIELYWNVNVCILKSNLFVSKVLIELYWNVNQKNGGESKSKTSY